MHVTTSKRSGLSKLNSRETSFSSKEARWCISFSEIIASGIPKKSTNTRLSDRVKSIGNFKTLENMSSNGNQSLSIKPGKASVEKTIEQHNNHQLKPLI